MNLFFLSLSVFPHPPFPVLPLDERQALPQTEISPVIFTEAHSRWGKKCNGYNRNEREEGYRHLCSLKSIYLLSSILFHLSFLFVQLLSEDRDLLWTASEDVWEDVFFLLKTRPTAWSVKMVWFHLMFIFLFPFLLFELLGPGISNQDHLYTTLPWGGMWGFPIAVKWEQENNDIGK